MLTYVRYIRVRTILDLFCDLPLDFLIIIINQDTSP